MQSNVQLVSPTLQIPCLCILTTGISIFCFHISCVVWCDGVNGIRYGQPISIGIQVDQCYDIGRIREIHFWPFWAALGTPIENWQHLNAVSLDMKRTDWEIVEDVFSFG